MYNPSLRREPRYEPAGVIPVKQDSSLIDWLAATGRLMPREHKDTHEIISEEEEDISFIEDDDIYDEDDVFDDEDLGGDDLDDDLEI